MVLQWGATDQGLAEALAGVGIDIATAMPDVEAEFLGMLGELLRAGQKAGAVRSLYQILDDRRLNHRVDVVAGVLGGESATLLRAFFERLRK